MGYTTTLQLNLFPNEPIARDFLSLRGEAFLRAGAQLVLRLLWQSIDSHDIPTDIFNRDIIKTLLQDPYAIPSFYRALLKTSDPFILRAARLEIQDSFERLYSTLQITPPSNENEHEKVQFCIYNMLSIFAMFNPSPYETIRLPQCINHQWKMVEFSITPIELSPSSGFFSYFMGENDRLFSYGLTAINEENVPRILIHKGTGWNTSPGVVLQTLSDLWPNKTPGETFFEWQQANIDSWIDESDSYVISCGQSLGGALAYLTAMHRPDKVRIVSSLVPPGLAREFTKEHPIFGNWYKTPNAQKPLVQVQRPIGDFVSKFGQFPQEFQLKNLSVANEKLMAAPFRNLFAHMRNVSACDSTITETKSIEKENRTESRKANNSWLYNHRWIIFYGLLIPNYILRRPINYLLSNNPLRLFLFVALMLCCLFIPSLAGVLAGLPILALIPNSFLACTIASWSVSHYLSKTVSFIIDICLNSSKQILFYFSNLQAISVIDAFLNTAFRGINFIFADFLQIAYDCYDGLNKIFTSNKLAIPAEINTEQYHTSTNNLNAHPQPSWEDRLQTLCLTLLLYLLAWPLKFMFYDVPQRCFSIFSPASSITENNQQDDMNASINPVDIEMGYQSPSNNKIPTFFSDIPQQVEPNAETSSFTGPSLL